MSFFIEPLPIHLPPVAGHALQASRFDPAGKPKGLILMLHGFKGFKDWGFFPFAAALLAREGFVVLTFNYSHNGIGPHPQEMTELDKFRDNTFSRELGETLAVIEWAKAGSIPGIPAGLPLGLIGHSRGGAMALLAGAGHAAVNAICTWAAVSYFNRYPPEVIEQWKREGMLEIKNQRTGQVLQLGWNLHADLMAHIGDTLSIEKAAQRCTQPLLIMHGDKDEAVPVEDAENLHRWCPHSSLQVIAEAGHTFGIVHPFAGNNPQFEQVMRHSLLFFTQHLKPQA